MDACLSSRPRVHGDIAGQRACGCGDHLDPSRRPPRRVHDDRAVTVVDACRRASGHSESRRLAVRPAALPGRRSPPARRQTLRCPRLRLRHNTIGGWHRTRLDHRAMWAHEVGSRRPVARHRRSDQDAGGGGGIGRLDEQLRLHPDVRSSAVPGSPGHRLASTGSNGARAAPPLCRATTRCKPRSLACVANVTRPSAGCPMGRNQVVVVDRDIDIPDPTTRTWLAAAPHPGRASAPRQSTRLDSSLAPPAGPYYRPYVPTR